MSILDFICKKMAKSEDSASKEDGLVGSEPSAIQAVEKRESKQWILVGLGNPGAEYDGTRHNVGFAIIDLLAERYKLSFKSKQKALWASCYLDNGDELILLKPQTFMNDSGEALKRWRKKLGFELTQVLVIYDEVSLPIGRLRLRYGGGSAGHNGIKSLVEKFGTADFYRLRVGVDRPADSADLADYVLAPFEKEELSLLSVVIQSAADAALMLCNESYEAAMEKYNSKKAIVPLATKSEIKGST